MVIVGCEAFNFWSPGWPYCRQKVPGGASMVTMPTCSLRYVTTTWYPIKFDYAKVACESETGEGWAGAPQNSIIQVVIRRPYEREERRPLGVFLRGLALRRS